MAVIILAFNVTSFSQQAIRTSGLPDVIQSYSHAYARQERLFVFVNGGFFYPGENIAFKAVLFDADMHIKTDGSRFFYLQLVNNASGIAANYTFELHSGECSGQIRLPDTLLTGLYTLRAFTRWMQSYSADNVFCRPLLVISPLNGEMTILSAVRDTIPVQFYPESGNFISGVENHMLVRVNRCCNHLIPYLNIIDDLGDTILHCPIDAGGTGKFMLIPEPGRTYHAVSPDFGQSQRIFKLPDQQSEGYCMNIDEDKTYLHVIIASAKPTIDHRALYLTVMTGDAEKSFVRQINMIDHRAQISFQTNILPAGLSQIALFSDDSILCSRLWYRKNEQKIEAKPNIQGTAKIREMVAASVDFPGSAGQAKILAVSVTEYNAVTDSLLYSEADHYRYFDLYSSLSQPDRLPMFEAKTSADYINDCLMAVPTTLAMHQVFYNNIDNRYIRETQGLIYNGRIVDPSTRLPVSNAVCMLSYPDSVAHINYSQTDETGRFLFTLNDKYYNRQLYLTVQGFPQSTNPVSIIADDPFDLSAAGINVMPLDHPSLQPIISNHKNVAMAYRFFYSDGIQASLTVSKHHASYQTDFYGRPDFTLIPAEYESLPDIFEIRKNLIPPLKLKVNDDYCPMFVFDDYMHLFPDKKAFVMLNSIPYPSLKNILGLNSDLIRKIDIKYGRHYYDHFLMYGIVSISTTKPVIIEPYFSTHITTIKVETEPDGPQSTPLISKGTIPDIRHTLCWEPVSVKADSAKDFQFRTSDIKGKYQLRVFSVARDGYLHCTSKMITVL